MTKIILSACIVLLTACVPVISHEYDVEGRGERSSATGCSRSAEVKITTHPADDMAIVFWSSADRIRPTHRLVSISFVLSNDDVVELTKPEVLISSKSNSIASAVPITTVRRAANLSSPSCDPPQEATYQPPSEAMRRMPGMLNGYAVTNSVFVIDVLVAGNPGKIIVKLPPLLVNDHAVDIPAVTFLSRLSVTYPAQII